MYLIGIVGRCYYNKDNQCIIQTSDVIRKMMIERDNCACITVLPTENINYLDVLNGKDMVNKDKLDYILNKCDAFIVPGGTYAYHFDEYVIDYAIKKDKPLLAICLGFQVLCSMFAKNRTKFDMTERVNLDYHFSKNTDYKHDVIISPGTKLASILDNKRIPVNSCHHDIVNFDMNELIINAKSDDGIIEGVEYPNSKFIIGLQWHPEYLMDEHTEKIVDEFIKNM